MGLFSSREERAITLLDEIRKVARMALELQIHPVVIEVRRASVSMCRLKGLSETLRAIDNGFPTLLGDGENEDRFFQDIQFMRKETPTREVILKALGTELARLRKELNVVEDLLAAPVEAPAIRATDPADPHL